MALGFRNRTDLANSLSVTVRTLADIEHGVRKGTYALLENTLGWASGSIGAILAGGEPNVTVVELRRTTHNPLSHTPTDALSRASTEELLLKMRRRIITPRDRLPRRLGRLGSIEPRRTQHHMRRHGSPRRCRRGRSARCHRRLGTAQARNTK